MTGIKKMEELLEKFNVTEEDGKFNVCDEDAVIADYDTKDDADNLCDMLNEFYLGYLRSKNYDEVLSVLQANYHKHDTIITLMDGSEFTIGKNKNSHINGRLLCVPAEDGITDPFSEIEDAVFFNMDHIKQLVTA